MRNLRGAALSSSGRRYEMAAAPGERKYYHRAGVCITDHFLFVNGQHYDIVELGRMWTTRSPRNTTAAGTAVFAAMMLLGLTVAWPSDDPVSRWLTVVAISLVPIGLVVGVSKARSRDYELWADYQGADVCLLATSDRQAYGQICRALIRSRETLARASHPSAEFMSPESKRQAGVQHRTAQANAEAQSQARAQAWAQSQQSWARAQARSRDQQARGRTRAQKNSSPAFLMSEADSSARSDR